MVYSFASDVTLLSYIIIPSHFYSYPLNFASQWSRKIVIITMLIVSAQYGVLDGSSLK